MVLEILELPQFLSDKKKILKKFPNIADEIEEALNELKEEPDRGERYPGFGDIDIRKIRVGLKKYNVGKRGGLRLIYLTKDERLIPLILYHKGGWRSEKETKKRILARLRDIAKSLTLK